CFCRSIHQLFSYKDQLISLHFRQILLIFDYIINSFKMGRNRSISSIIGKATRRPSQPMLTRKKRDNKVPYYCNQCNGKLVLKRTKLFVNQQVVQQQFKILATNNYLPNCWLMILDYYHI